jgi:hypothetical protein
VSSKRFRMRLWLALVIAALAIPASAEWKEKVLYSFQGGTNDGAFPAGGVVFDPQGNLYGVLQDFGPGSCAPIGNECGAVFQLTPPALKGGSWTETLIYEFQGKESNDGESPNGGLLIDGQGNLYGVTAYGGTGDCVLLGVPAGCGTVYEISPPKQKGGAWTETILYSFPTAKQGYLPNGNLVFDSAGNLYGATTFGGTKGTTCDAFYGGQCGVVFELSPPKQKGGKWTAKVLHAFAGGSDGANPNGGLVLDGKERIYGTTANGGNQGCKTTTGVGCGTAFELKPPTKMGASWTEKHIHVFTGDTDGGAPNGGLTFDQKGALSGTAGGGGKTSQGVVFRLVGKRLGGKWLETVLHRFSASGNAPCCPMAKVTFDASGNIYSVSLSGKYFRGTAFQLKPPAVRGDAWSFAILYTFKGAPDAAYPEAGLIFDDAGSLYSTTKGGGTGTCSGGCGTVFELDP